MEHIKKIKKEGGTILLTVRLWICRGSWDIDINGNQFRYDIGEMFIPKGKRKPILNTNFSTEDEKHQAKVELFELLKPIIKKNKA